MNKTLLAVLCAVLIAVLYVGASIKTQEVEDIEHEAAFSRGNQSPAKEISLEAQPVPTPVRAVDTQEAPAIVSPTRADGDGSVLKETNDGRQGATETEFATQKEQGEIESFNMPSPPVAPTLDTEGLVEARMILLQLKQGEIDASFFRLKFEALLARSSEDEVTRILSEYVEGTLSGEILGDPLFDAY